MRETSWLKRIRKGDKYAGERFVTEHYPRVYRFLRYLTGNVDTAEDLTQQTFAKAWQALDGFKGEAKLATWLHRIAYHEYTHWLRDRKPTVSLDAAAELAHFIGIQEFATLVLPRALEQLSPEMRETFLLYHIQELSVPEVAKVLEIAPGTVKSRLFTARQRLRELLQETEPSAEKAYALSAPLEPISKEVLSNELPVNRIQSKAH